jgi:hypothetical protein
MRRCGARCWIVAVGLAAPLAGAGVRADLTSVEEQAIASTYGSGVHAYFAGDFARSYEILSQAIEAGTADPRAWYFRGLAALKLGRTDEAEADFAAGSKHESENTGAWGVARSLERVQGCDRAKLERYRVRARVASLQEDRRRTRLRYLGVESAEPDVLRDRVPETVRPPLPGQPFQTPDPADEPAVEAAPEVDDRVVPADSLPAPVDPAEPPMQLERDGTTEL